MVDTSDFLLLVAALFIYSILQLSTSSVLLNNNRVRAKTEMDYYAVALAQNIADDARGKAFDENALVGKPLTIPDDFSSVLGPEGTENYNTFNDFDDYNGYTRTDTTQDGIYKIQCTVNYMTPGDMTKISTVKTQFKRLLVQVIPETAKDTVAVTYIKPYY